MLSKTSIGRYFMMFLSIVWLNAFIDLGHKIIIQNTVIKFYDGETQVILTALVNGLILLPFILMLSPSGFLADRFNKPKIMVYSAYAAVLITMGIAVSYYLGMFEVAFAMTFLLAIQSAIYSPAKYGYIRELLGPNGLSKGNAAVQGVTIVAILLGMGYFSFQFEGIYNEIFVAGNDPSNPGEVLIPMLPLAITMVILSIVEALMARKLPVIRPDDESIDKFEVKKYLAGKYMKGTLSAVFNNHTIWICIVGISIFWGLSQALLSIYPTFIEINYQTNSVSKIQMIMGMSGIGIVIGSYLASRFSRNYIETGLVPIGAIGVAVSLLLIAMGGTLEMQMVYFGAMGLFGALFIVPLNSLIQYHSTDENVGRVLSSNNFIQNIVMVATLLITSLVVTLGVSTNATLYGLALAAALGAIYCIIKIPQSLVRFSMGLLVSQRYKLIVKGMDNIPNTDGVLLLGNHISWVDWAIISMASPRRIRFVMDKTIYNKWYLTWFLKMFGVVPISAGASKGAITSIAHLLDEGEVVCLFPEGAISRNGQLGEFKGGYTRSAKEVLCSDVKIVPFYLLGLWGSRMSRASDKLVENRKTFSLTRDVTVIFGKPIDILSTPAVVKQQVTELSQDGWDHYIDSLGGLSYEITRNCLNNLNNTVVIDTKGDQEMSGRKFLAISRVLKSHLKGITAGQTTVAALLPTSSIGIIANHALMELDKSVVNINFTAAPEAVHSSLELAEVSTIITSSQFIAKLVGKGINVEKMIEGKTVIQLEDLKEKGVLSTKKVLTQMVVLQCIRALSCLGFPFARKKDLNKTAVILFSSGSEGKPKGIELSHRNLLSNIKQMSDVLNPDRNSVIMAQLPLFHAFGMSACCFMPVVEGMLVICHPDPTDALNVSKAIAKHKATILFGTSTFFRLYTRNKKVHPLMLESLRIVVGGAEKVSEDVRKDFSRKFGLTIYEGYGSSETSPVISVNLPDHMDKSHWHVQKGGKEGSVGMPLPGTSIKIVDLETLEPMDSGEEGLILVSGPQVMKGYLKNPEKTEEVLIEIDGKTWYHTGDKGFLDKDMMLHITDRISRFIKTAGEMVGLGTVQNAVADLLPSEEVSVATIGMKDEKKGEVVALVFASDTWTEDDVKAAVKASSIIPIMQPSQYIKINEIPALGAGKTDYKAIEKIVKG